MDRSLRFGAVLAFAMTLTATCAPRVASAQSDEEIARFRRTVVAPLMHPEALDVRRMQVEIGKRADGSALSIDLTLPAAGGSRPAPIVLLLHGGLPDAVPVRPSAWQVYRDWGTALAGSGTAAIMFDHSLGAPKQRLDQALAEIDTVLAWVAREGPLLGVDVRRLGTMSFSAGGLLTAELLDAKRPLRVERLVLFYPLTGLPARGPSLELVGQQTADRMNLGKQAKRVAGRGAPLLVFRAGRDEIPGLLPLLDDAITALLAADARVEVVNVPGAPHGFDFLTDTPEVRAAIDQALTFLSQG